MADYVKELAELGQKNIHFFGATGVAGKGFREMHSASIAAGSLDTKTKELMSLCVGIALRCHGCMLSHVDSAIKAGATIDDIHETIEVALMMQGGPAVVYGEEALEMAEQLLAAKA